MGDLVLFRAMGVNLGFSQNASDTIFTDQGVNSIEAMGTLSEADVTNLMRVVRKPGGGEDGQAVSFMAERAFNAACHMVRYYQQVQRPLTFHDIRTNALEPHIIQRNIEEEQKSLPQPEVPKVDFLDHPKSLESVDNYLSQLRGVRGTQLNYVMRQRLVPLPAADDPADGYETLDLERVQRAPIVEVGAVDPSEEDGPWDPVFKVDDAAAYQYLVEIFQSNAEVWVHVKSVHGQRSARKLVLAYTNHYLGPHRCDSEVKKIIAQLQSITYHGKSRGFTLDKCITRHVECHNRLSNLEAYGYLGLDPSLQVSYLTTSIQAEHLKVVTAQILATPEMRRDFGAASNAYRDYDRLMSAGNDSRNVSGVGTHGGGRGTGSDLVEDRWLTDEEYNKLSKDQKTALNNLRRGRTGDEKGDKGGGKPSKASVDKKVAKLQRKVSNQRRELKALKQQNRDLQSDDGSEDEESNAGSSGNDAGGSGGRSNRNNSALSRGRRGGRRGRH